MHDDIKNRSIGNLISIGDSLVFLVLYANLKKLFYSRNVLGEILIGNFEVKNET